MTKIFISFRYMSDSVRRDELQSLIENPEVGQRHEAVTVKKRVADEAEGKPREARDRMIREEIKSQMSGCRALVCIVGDNTHNSPWIEYEVEVAHNRGMGIVAVAGKGTTGGAPPALQRLEVPVMPWHAKEIAAAIDRAVSQGGRR